MKPFTARCTASKSKTRQNFNELLNNGAVCKVQPRIEIEVTFTGLVLGQEQTCVLKRTYILNTSDKPVESVSLNMNGNTFVYGTATPLAQRIKNEQQVNKIIKANLPQELRKYFLFDAMQSSDLLKDGVFAQIIKDNIEKVIGFNKYLQLKRAAKRLQQEKAAERLNAEKEKEEYEGLCAQKDGLEKYIEDNIKEQNRIFKNLLSVKNDYDAAKSSERNLQNTKMKIEELDGKIDDVLKSASTDSEDLKVLVENMGTNIFLSKLAADINNEVNNIIRVKDAIHQEQSDSYSPEKVREIAKKIFAYLRDLAVITSDIDEETVVSFIMEQQSRPGKDAPYSFLDEADVQALINLVNNNGVNTFARFN